MYQDPEERVTTYWHSFVSCLGLTLRLCCCINRDDELSLGDGTRAELLEGRDRRLLSNQESAIETTLSPPRTALLEHRSPVKGAASSSLQHLQQWQQQQQATGGRSTHQRTGSAASVADSTSGTPTKGGLKNKSQSALSLLDDDDICPTCLEPYTEENPKVLTKCGHHYHLPCIYEWLERSETCPMCGREMSFEEVL